MDIKYFIYCRKSSEQEDRQMLSLESQDRELTILAETEQLKIVDVYQESGSAHVVGRPKFNEMLQRIAKGEANGLIVWDESRIARNSLDGGTVIYMMDLKQIVEIRKPGRMYINSPDDKSWLALCFMMSKKESDDKGKNVKNALKTKAEKGWLPSGAKAGYMNDKYADKGNKTVLQDPVRFPLIRKCWDLMLTGTYTVMQILRMLNEEWGYTTPMHRKIGGKPMSRSQIYKTLTDPFYYGEFEYPVGSGNWYQGTHTPMISKKEFDRVQMLLGRKGRPRPRAHSFDYTGLLECGECSATITAEEKFQMICSGCKYKFSSLNKTECPKCYRGIEEMNNPTLLHYIYYHCTKRKNPMCTQGSIRLEDLEKQFDLLLSRIQISKRFKDWAIKYLNELTDVEVADREMMREATNKEYNLCVKSIDNLVKLKISGSDFLTDDEYKAQKQSLMTQKALLEEKLQSLSGRANNWIELSEKAFDFACNARYWFEHGSTQEKRELLASLGSNLTLRDKIVSISLDKPLMFIEEAKKSAPEIIDMLEPNKEADNTVQIEDIWSKNPSMLRD